MAPGRSFEVLIGQELLTLKGQKMKQNQRSKTAEAAAACRAWHSLSGHPIVFKDPFAIQLTSIGWRTILKSQVLKWIIIDNLFHRYHPVFAHTLGRACYTEELLEKTIADGLDQYVLLGAGLDSFALRRKDLASRLKVYEIDHPASQESKRNRFIKLRLDLPDNLEFVPVDFEKESLSDGLKKGSYSNKRRGFFSWMGTTPYLTRDAIFQTLRSIASVATPGSELIFDFLIPKKLADPADLPLIEAIERAVERRGEPFKAVFNPSTLQQDLGDLGFEMVEHLTPKQLYERCFAKSLNKLRPISNLHLAHFRLCA